MTTDRHTRTSLGAKKHLEIFSRLNFALCTSLPMHEATFYIIKTGRTREKNSKTFVSEVGEDAEAEELFLLLGIAFA